MRQILASLLISIFFLSGCFIAEYPKRFLGYSTAKFKNENTLKIEKIFKTSKEVSFKKSENIINALKAKITHSSYKEGYIIAFNLSKYFENCLDSTESAIFIDEIGKNEVKIIIACNNRELARNFAAKFFEMFSQNVEDWKLEAVK